MASVASYCVKELLAMDDTTLAELRTKGIAAGDEAVAFTEAFANRAADASYAEYAQFFREFEPVYQKLIVANMRFWLFAGEEIAKMAHEHLTHLDEETRREVSGVMTMPREVTYSQRAEAEFAELIAQARTEGLSSLEAGIAAFSQKYLWFPYEYVGPNVWDVPSVTKRIEEIIATETSHHHVHDVVVRQTAVIEQHQLSPDVVRLFDILQTLALLQDDRKMYNAKICYFLNGTIFTELAKKLDVTVQEARYLDLPLLERITQGTANDLRQILAERLTLFVALQNTEGDVHYFEGAKAEDELRKLGIVEETVGDVTELKGRTANPGVARGTVRVMKTSSDVTEFNEGDILVTGMTTPDFVIYMKKAGAIVTDEGGVTCHAAIVSRELGKPCIIATKNASKVLHSGEHIEVDATAGVIRKIV